MKIREIIQPKMPVQSESQTQDLVAQDIVSYNGTSAIMEGVAQILRRVKGKGLKTGFRCTSGPRKGRIVAKPSTCFAKLNPEKGAKIKRKRQAKARIAGKKMAITKRSGAGSRRLKTAQIKSTTKQDRPGPRSRGRAYHKSKAPKVK